MTIFLKIRSWRLFCIDLIFKEGIDLIKSNRRKKCMICHYWFFNHRFKFQDSVYNGWNDLTMLSVNISNIVIITVKNVDYRCIIHDISKSEGINSSKSSSYKDRGYIYIYIYIYIYKVLS